MTAPTDRTAARAYRFAPRDRSGWLLGLTGPQCLLMAAAVAAAGAALNAGLAAPAVIAILAAGSAAAFATSNGTPMYEVAPVAVAARHRRRPWMAPLRAPAGSRPVRLALPDTFGRLRLDTVHAAPWPGRLRPTGIAVVTDERTGTCTAALRVHGREFALLDRAEQERLVAGWGDALGGFSAERSPVTRVTVAEWASPAPLDEQLRYLHDHGVDPASPAAADYLALLDDAGPMATRHDVVVTVTVDPRRLRARGNRDRHTMAVDTLLEQLRLFAGRLDTAGLHTEPPMSPGELAHALRLRCDPTATARLAARARSLTDTAEPVSPANATPLAVTSRWRAARVDHSLHAAYWVAEWPRLDVGPNWLEPLLLHPGGTRTVAVTFEPVPPSRSQRQIDRDATRLAADETQRARGGFRIGARHHRAQTAVAEREAELVAGYRELAFVGLVIVTAATLDALEHSCAEYEQAAAHAGLELRRLDGRHDLALAAALPLGRPIANPRLP